jgi:hypothetical protein
LLLEKLVPDVFRDDDGGRDVVDWENDPLRAPAIDVPFADDLYPCPGILEFAGIAARSLSDILSGFSSLTVRAAVASCQHIPSNEAKEPYIQL